MSTVTVHMALTCCKITQVFAHCLICRDFNVGISAKVLQVSLLGYNFGPLSTFQESFKRLQAPSLLCRDATTSRLETDLLYKYYKMQILVVNRSADMQSKIKYTHKYCGNTCRSLYIT